MSEKEELKIIGSERGLTRYLRGATAGSDDRGIIYCVHPESDREEINRVSEQIRASRLPVVLISSWEVYPADAESPIYENSRVMAMSEYGERCQEAERQIGDTCRSVGLPCAILRPAMMFGTDIGGEGARMFGEVVSGRWFGVRQTDTVRSLVCALDVARVAPLMLGKTGVWNISDGRKSGLHALAAAMSANTGLSKRPIVLPLPVARLVAHLADTFPFIYRGWRSEALKRKLSSRVLDTKALTDILPKYKFYDTLAVIARSDESYPYETK